MLIRRGGRYGFVVTPGYHCDLCGPSAGQPLTVRVSSLEGWYDDNFLEGLADGEALRKACASCGLVIEIVGTVIPIECSSYDCPDCGQNDALEYWITDIEVQNLPDSTLTFGTDVKCRECGSRRRFHSQLDTIAQCVMVQLSSHGIDLEIVRT